MPKSSKRPATCAADGKPSKRPRADVHPLQERLAHRAAGELDLLSYAIANPIISGWIIAAPMGTGKPRIAGKCLDLVVPKLVEDRDEDVPGVLTIVVATDAKHGREQAAQYGTDFPGPYHCSDLDAVLRMFKGGEHAARIMIPFASFRKMCYKKRGGAWGIWDLLEKLGQPELVLLIDEVTEVYKPANGRLPKAIDALRTKYAKNTDATFHVVGMSGTPELDNEAYSARAETLFGTAPNLVKFTEAEEAQLLADINPQNKVGREETVEELPTPTGPAETLETLATLAVGNALYNDIRGDLAVKKLVSGDVLIPQILGDDQDGGVLFQKLAPGGKAPMFKVGKDGAIGKKAVPAHEAVLIAVDSPYGAQALCDALEELQARSGTEGELRAFTVRDLRLEAQAKATKEAAKVPHEWLKRDVADQKAALKAFLAAAAEQTGTAIAIIDKRQALSGTNDFAKNVQRAVAIGAWEPHELDQFYKRLGRACELKEGDLVPKAFYGVHLSSPFAANLIAPAKERAADKAMLTEKAKGALADQKKTAEKDAYCKAKDAAEVLAATGLPGDPALKYLECLGDADAFKENEYMPLIEHHEDCETEGKTDAATGEVTKTVTKLLRGVQVHLLQGRRGRRVERVAILRRRNPHADTH